LKGQQSLAFFIVLIFMPSLYIQILLQLCFRGSKNVQALL
jgi:hypothetical protein